MHKINYTMNIPDKPNISPSSLAALVNAALPGPNYILKTAPITTTLNIPAWESYRHIIEVIHGSCIIFFSEIFAVLIGQWASID